MAGAIPVIRPLRESLAGEQIVRVMGIVNGTTNYILTRMEEDGADYDDALAEAQELGLAERDPTADVEGHDAAAKAAILAALAFGSDVVDADVHREGISGISAADVAYASRLGYSVKLLAIAELIDGGPEISVRVHPAMVPQDPPAGLGARRLQRGVRRRRGERRAHALRPRRRRRADGQRHARRPGRRRAQPPAPARRRRRPSARARRCSPQNDMRSAFYLSMDVADRPGVLAAVAKVFGDHDVSIRAMEQVGLADEARLIFLTHVAREGDLLATIDELRRHQAVDRVERRAPGHRRARATTGRREPVVTAGWRGVMEEYRDLLPITGQTPVVTLLEGGTPLVPAPRLSERVGAHGLAQGRRGQPDRVVQGPRHDHGHLHGGRRGGQGGRVRVDRQHVRLGRGLRGAGRPGLRRCSSPRATSRWASWPRRSCTAPACCRCGATSTSC